MAYYKRVLILMLLLATGVPAAWSIEIEGYDTKKEDSLSKTIENMNKLILSQSIFDNSCKNFFNKILMPNISEDVRNTVEIIIISKRPLVKKYANVTYFEVEESKGDINPTLAGKFIETYSWLKFFYIYLPPSSKEVTENKLIVDHLEWLDLAHINSGSNEGKNFIIYMDFNVKYDKKLSVLIKEKFKKFKNNSIIITNTELGKYDYKYTDLEFMIPAFIRDNHVFNVGTKEVSLDSSISDRDQKIILSKFKSLVNIKTKIPVSTKSKGLDEVVNMSEYAAFPVILITAVTWLLNYDRYSRKNMIEVIEEKFLNNDGSIDLFKALQHIERGKFWKNNQL